MRRSSGRPHLRTLEKDSRLVSSRKARRWETELGEEEDEEEEEGTCSGALAKSPIITSKLDWAGGSLHGTGAQRKMKRSAEIRVKSRPPSQPPRSRRPLRPPPSLSTSSLSSTCPDFPYRFPFLPLFIASSLPRLICAFSTWPPRTRSPYEISFCASLFLLADFLHPLSGL